MFYKDKPTLRQLLRDARRHMTEADQATWNKQIADRFWAEVDWAKVQTVHTYIPMPDWKEIDTWPIIKRIWQESPHIKVASPRIGDNGRLEAVLISPKTRWGKHKTGISEPADGEVMPNDFQFDIIITPTLGFDDKGYRLGSGAGFYDRFLPGQTSARKIGLCYEMGLATKGIPADEHDAKLHTVVTESASYKF